ncbi:hypothetical protein KR018_009960, partial [Drosophila ironensis]
FIMAPNAARPSGRFCALGNHALKTPNRHIRDPVLLSFARKINPELPDNALLCMDCYLSLIKIFRLKVSNKRKHDEFKKKQQSSVSDVTTSQSTGSSSQQAAPAANSQSSTDSDQPTTSAAAAAKRKRREDENRSAPASTTTDSDDDANSNLSLNAVNGTRCPQYQPIPKRRQIVQIQKEVLDGYLQGITGG